MNKAQFWTLIGLSSAVVLLLIAHIILINLATGYQTKLAIAQQVINQGQASKSILEKIAVEVYKVSEAKQDQQLKDLMARQQITFNPNTDSASSNSGSTPAPAPASTTAH